MFFLLLFAGPPAKLLFVNRVDIRAVGVNGRNHELLVKHLHNAIAVDYHYRCVYIVTVFFSFLENLEKKF